MIYATTFMFIVLQACDPRLAALFVPVRPVAGHYDVCAVPDPIEAVADRGWTIDRLEPLDAFGAAGSYDRSRVSRLYGGLRPQVAHGWRQRGSQFESITLISPYPDPTLSHLERGTLQIRWTP